VISEVRALVRIHLNIGGLVAAGFDESGRYLLVVSHSGRGVFSAETWAQVARENALAYPEKGRAIGIGPIAGQSIVVAEKDYETDELNLVSPDGKFNLSYQSGTLTIASIE
jgi:hypothetical protein